MTDFKPMVVDLYHGDRVLDLAAAKAAGIVALIHKATQGAGVTDPMYHGRIEWARSLGLKTGAYHFNTGDSIENQVQHFFDVVQPDADTVMALDFEDNRASQMTIDEARQFLSQADAKLGRPLWLYSGNRIKEQLRGYDLFFSQHPLWLCQYGPKAVLPATWTEYRLWQYAADGYGPSPHTVPGIPGNIDCNLFNGPAEAFLANWK